ncbi:hypothetical protein DXG03_002718 [Asterophora parasitica]|uniref:Uncharacterized protein n=1 Tax=Asterophora parasitica TaxID=117018 RepID=A0A9P7KAV9_9AGAR|nr:hypothetical protein DXG03_002718 [Asterophora parasitica]
MSTAPGQGSKYAYTGLQQPYDNTRSSHDYGNTAAGPIPGTTSTVTAMASHPYATATPISDDDQDDTWQGTTAQIAARVRAQNRYQPNTLSTITESSTPLEGATPPAHSPSSYFTDIHNDLVTRGDGTSARGPSPSENREPFPVLAADRRVPPRPPTYTPQ